MRKNCVIDTDYYKTTHKKLYAPGVTATFSYAESRGGDYETVVFFGLQGWIKEHLLKPVTKSDVDFAEIIMSGMGVKFDRSGWDIIVNEYDGYLPVTIKAIPEGSKIPFKNALVTVKSNDPRLHWLVGYIETALIRLWYPTTIASRAYAIRKKIEYLYVRYADTTATPDFAFLDFSARGVECYEASAIGTAAFLTSFKGTDTVAGVVYAYDYYGGGINGFSVTATEHSVMCSYEKENEKESFRHLVEQAEEGSILSVVCDTWNIYRACGYWNELQPLIRSKKLTLVIRPDSGDPQNVLPKMLKILEKGFPTKPNDKGLKVFEDIKILWGDRIDEETVMPIMCIFPKIDYGVENLILGSGGGTFQKLNRDTMNFAFKASAVEKKGKWIPIRKSPITDPGKNSKAGLLDTIRLKDGTGYRTMDLSISRQFGTSMLETVYENGKLHRDQTMQEIINLVAS